LGTSIHTFCSATCPRSKIGECSPGEHNLVEKRSPGEIASQRQGSGGIAVPQKKDEQSKGTPALAPESITPLAELLSKLLHTRELSVAEFRASVPYMRTVRELQHSFTEHFNRWCETFPALLARYRERQGPHSENVEREMEGLIPDMKGETKSWFSLACDGEPMTPEWRCPAWLTEYPIQANSPSAHMPVELLGGRLANAGAEELLAAMGQSFEEKLQLGLNLSTSSAPGVPNPPHSEDYRSIWYAGEWHALTERRAKIVEVIHAEHKRGIPEVSSKFIMQKVRTPNSRLPDSFRHFPLWGTFIAPGTTRGTVRLDWPDTRLAEE
jgi:hypothetical protein